jgi:hypothetical protein
MDTKYTDSQYTRLIKSSYSNVPINVGSVLGHHTTPIISSCIYKK